LIFFIIYCYIMYK